MSILNHSSLGKVPLPGQILCEFDGMISEVCQDPRSLFTAYQLRYNAYRNGGDISENKEKLLYDQYDWLPNSRSHLIWYENQPVGTIRSCIYSDKYDWMPTESFTYFADVIKSKIGEDVRILESNRFAVSPDFQGRKSLFAQMLMFRIHGLNSAVHDCDFITTAVRAKHAPFYIRFLGMEQISDDPVYYPPLDDDILLMGNKRQVILDKALTRGMPDIGLPDILKYASCANISLADPIVTI